MDFYTFLQIIIVSIVGTCAMTFFSYTVSRSYRELYKEPILLTFVLVKTNVELSKQTKKNIGWLSHYLIGFIFSLAYLILWLHPVLKISIISGFILGAVSGIIGIIGWMLIFKLAGFKLKIDLRNYYVLLFFAHIIFAFIVTGTYWLSSSIYISVNTLLNN